MKAEVDSESMMTTTSMKLMTRTTPMPTEETTTTTMKPMTPMTTTMKATTMQATTMKPMTTPDNEQRGEESCKEGE